MVVDTDRAQCMAREQEKEMTDWRDDGEAAEFVSRQQVERDVEEVILKCVPVLTESELALLLWAAGIQHKEHRQCV
jgi:hypothetical protein